MRRRLTETKMKRATREAEAASAGDTLTKMKATRRWLVHRAKVPHYANGSTRSATDTPEDQAQLVSYDEACDARAAGGYDGIGFALGPDGNGGHWQGIDLDDIKANGLASIADSMPGYVERSPSGNGAHAIGYGERFDTLGANGSGIEAYAAGRYFTVTERAIRHAALIDLAPIVLRDLAPLHGKAVRRCVARIARGADGVVVKGARNVCLSREAYRLRKLGLSVKQIAPVLLAMNNELCSPPLPDREVRKIAKGKERIQPDRGVARRVGEILFMSGSHVKMEPINWVWNGWLACGAFHLLGGAPGAGKTTVLLKLAATVTAGMTWPDGTRCEPGNVFIWSGEDRFEDTLLPRLVAMGGDRSRFYYISALSDEGEKRSFDPANDVAALADALDKVPGGIAMLIVDPVIVIAKKDSHKNAETRSDLQPLVDLAKRHSCIAIGNTHFTKGTQGTNPVDRITGSLAFAAAARTVMVCARVEGSQERLFLNAKGNNRKETGGGFAYSIETRHVHEDKVRIETSAVEWGELLQGEARDLLNRAEGLKDGRSHDTEAMQFLRAQLADGPKPIKDIVAAASEPGYSRSQLNRARERLRVLSDGVCWTDPVSRAVIAKLSKSAEKKGRV